MILVVLLLVRLVAIGGGELDGDVDNGGYNADDVGVIHLGLLQGRLLGLKEQWTEHR